MIQNYFFSVQFYPENYAEPRDTENLFQIFLDIVQSYKSTKPINAKTYLVEQLTKRVSDANAPPSAFCKRPKKVLILGSNGLTFEETGDFNYSPRSNMPARKQSFTAENGDIIYYEVYQLKLFVIGYSWCM